MCFIRPLIRSFYLAARSLFGLVTANKTLTKQPRFTALIFMSVFFLIGSQSVAAQSITYDRNGLKIELSEDVQAAIDSGVSLTFENEFAHSENFFFIHWRTNLLKYRFVVTRQAKPLYHTFPSIARNHLILLPITKCVCG